MYLRHKRSATIFLGNLVNKFVPRIIIAEFDERFIYHFAFKRQAIS
jgi:hypothetical protein